MPALGRRTAYSPRMVINQNSAKVRSVGVSAGGAPSRIFDRQGPVSSTNTGARRTALLAFAILSSYFLGGFCSPAATITWTNMSGGSWLTPQNWDPNQVPAGLTDTAIITSGATYTVTLDGPLALSEIILGVAGGAGTQTLAWSGGTLSDCSVTIATNGVLNLIGSTDKSLQRCTINNAGTITWAGTGQLIGAVNYYDQTVLITNLPGALFDI
jgi:hypothetical protein